MLLRICALCFKTLFCSLCWEAAALGINRRSNSKNDRPNILWILADDLHYEAEEFARFPNLRNFKENSLEFINHVSQSPLCGPARASLLVGRFPHNSGYKSQKLAEDKFLKLQDESIGKWLTDAGYYTAFLGKYVNSLDGGPKTWPTGWRYFGGFTSDTNPWTGEPLGGAYTYYNTSQWDLEYDTTGTTQINKVPGLHPIKIWEGVHQADVLANQTIDHAYKAASLGQPFFIFTNPLMVHHGYCGGPFPSPELYDQDDPYLEMSVAGVEISPCAKKNRPAFFLHNTFDDDWLLHMPTKSFGERAVGMHPGDEVSIQSWLPRYEMGRRNRTLSAMDLDDMIGTIINGLTSLGLMENTYVIFTSDNGYHMGEHSLFYGKEMPYEHDIRVPLLIRTPMGASGMRTIPTSHVDITRTIVDIANAAETVTPSLDALDGKSFAEALTSFVAPLAWRNFSYSEMFEKERTWRNIRFIGGDGVPEWSLHFWCGGFTELYHLRDDPDQMMNVLDPSAGESKNAFGKKILSQWMPIINGIGSCAGATCNEPIVTKYETELSTLLPCSANSLAQDPTLAQDSNCETGIANSGICCHSQCGACGGADCSQRPGGASNCCSITIAASERSCLTDGPPCVMPI